MSACRHNVTVPYSSTVLMGCARAALHQGSMVLQCLMPTRDCVRLYFSLNWSCLGAAIHRGSILFQYFMRTSVLCDRTSE